MKNIIKLDNTYINLDHISDFEFVKKGKKYKFDDEMITAEHNGILLIYGGDQKRKWIIFSDDILKIIKLYIISNKI